MVMMMMMMRMRMRMKTTTMMLLMLMHAYGLTFANSKEACKSLVVQGDEHLHAQ